MYDVWHRDERKRENVRWRGREGKEDQHCSNNPEVKAIVQLEWQIKKRTKGRGVDTEEQC